nr:MAG TPA: hypothetical protein [Caudoviricetes sp.]DAX13871.1 MAG TPA: hypothetical protein [Bacteriophage sp.]
MTGYGVQSFTKMISPRYSSLNSNYLQSKQ